MWKQRLSRYAPALITALVLFLLTPLGTRAQNNVLNYFDQPDANGNNVLNINGNGGLKFDGKVTDIDHGLVALNTQGYGQVTTNLTSIVDCLVGLKTVGPANITLVTAMWTTGSGSIEVFAWKPTSTSVTTLIPASAPISVPYSCFGT